MHRDRQRAFDIGIGEDDVRRLAAAFERAALQIDRRERHDLLRRRVAAGERHLVDARMLGERRARGRAVARHDIEHARRKPRFLHELRDLERGDRRLLGGLQHHRVAGGERRADLPRIEQDRRIPRQDRADHAHRLAPRIGERVGLERDLLALDLVGRAREIDQPIDRALHFADRVAQRLAVVAGFELGQPRRVAADQLGELVQQQPALRGGDLVAPGALHRRLRGGDGPVDVGVVAFGHLGPDRLGRGIDGGDRARRMGRDPLAADIEAIIASFGHGHLRRRFTDGPLDITTLLRL